MNFSSQNLPELWLLIGDGLVFLIFLGCIWRAPWGHLKNAVDFHVLMASCLILWGIWQINAHIPPDVEFHLLLITTVTLMFGVSFAILIAAVVQALLVLNGHFESWTGYSISLICIAVLPSLTTFGVYWLAYLWCPRNFFVYIYVTAFLGGAIAMLVSRLAGLSLLLLSGNYSMDELSDSALMIIPMLFPEAFINGALMTLLIVYYPEWVGSFNDDKYLRNK